MKILKYSFFIFMIVAAFSNLPFINKQFLYSIDQNHFRYSNLNASFTYEEYFGFKDGYMNDWTIKGFVEETNPAAENKTVYRLYKINPLCFWRWSYYLFTSRDYKYKDWEEIKKNRVPYDQDNMWQRF